MTRLLHGALALTLAIPWATAAASPTAGHDTVSTKKRTTAEIAPGVYVIRHEDAPDTFPQGNTTVVVGERAVLVVDSCYLPSSARKDIQQIRAWTKKPVRYLVNTHWHYDHTMGNGAYREAFPGITVVAHTQTRKQIAGYNPQWFARFPERAARFQKVIDDKKDQNGKALSASELDEYRTALRGVQPVWKEFKTLGKRTDMVPTLAFEETLEIDLGRREVRLMHLGRGNTAGDVIVHLPAEKIVVAGDLLDHPVPYLGGGYPVELIETLERMRRLEPATIVPGHGKVLRGTAYLALVTDFLRAVVAAVDQEINRVGNGSQKLADVKEGVRARFPLAQWRKRFAGDDKEAADFFDGFSFDGVVTAAYAALWPR